MFRAKCFGIKKIESLKSFQFDVISAVFDFWQAVGICVSCLEVALISFPSFFPSFSELIAIAVDSLTYLN